LGTEKYHLFAKKLFRLKIVNYNLNLAKFLNSLTRGLIQLQLSYKNFKKKYILIAFFPVLLNSF